MNAYPSTMLQEQRKVKELFEHFFTGLKKAGPDELCPIKK